MPVDEARLNAFMEKFVHDIGAVMHAATVVLGDELGLYKALAEKPMILGQVFSGIPIHAGILLNFQESFPKSGESTPVYFFC